MVIIDGPFIDDKDDDFPVPKKNMVIVQFPH